MVVRCAGCLDEYADRELTSAGPMFAVFASRTLSDRWSLTAYGFLDVLKLSGDDDHRPLQTLFAPATPLHLPAAAVFNNLRGELRHFGGGLNVSLTIAIRGSALIAGLQGFSGKTSSCTMTGWTTKYWRDPRPV